MNSYDYLKGSGKPSKKPKLEAHNLDFDVICNPGHVVITLPIRTESEAQNLLSKTRFYKNGKPKPEHWTEKHARHKRQQDAVYLAMNQIKQQMKISLPCIVKMTRYASQYLDADDNLRISLKWIKDYIAAMLTNDFVPGRADSDKRIKWEYDQVKSKEYGVKIEIYWENI